MTTLNMGEKGPLEGLLVVEGESPTKRTSPISVVGRFAPWGWGQFSHNQCTRMSGKVTKVSERPCL
jgi:hypothetical protein